MGDLAKQVFKTIGTLADDKQRIQLVPYEKTFGSEDPQDPMFRACDSSKLAEAIGWDPKTTLEDMIKHTRNGMLRPASVGK